MKKIKLIDVCCPKQWKTISTEKLLDAGYPVYGANGKIGFYDEYNHEAETLMITCRGATCGSVCISEPFSYINGNAMCLDKLAKTVNLRYLYYFLRNYDFNNVISGSAQPQITIQGLQQVVVNLYDLPMQQKIVDELDCLSNIIEKKKKQLSDFDELIKSKFVEMFGNLKHTVRLGDCCDVHARIGWQSLTTKEHMQTGEFMLITGTDFQDNEINYSTCVYVSRERYEMDHHIILRNDDVLITKDGTIGKVAVVHNLPKPATLNGGVFVVRPDNRFNKEYISYVFKGPLFAEYIEKSKTGATIKHLNQKYLIEFRIPIPSNDRQKEFAVFSKRIDSLKFDLKQSIEETQNLFNERMQHYFGE